MNLFKNILLPIVLLTVIMSHNQACAQATAGTGLQPLEPTNGEVALDTLNIHLNIPIVNKPGIGMPLSLAMSYNSNSWGVSAGYWTPNPEPNPAGLTYDFWNVPSAVASSLMGELTYGEFNCGLSGENIDLRTITGYVDSSGSLHSISIPTPLTTVQVGNCPVNTSLTQTFQDGSGLTIYLNVDATLDTVTTRSGNVYTVNAASTITDPNGNTISLSDSVYTDTLGIQEVTVSSTANSTTYTYPISTASGPSTASVVVNYTAETLATKFGCSNVKDFPATSGYNFPTSVNLPDGSSYTFTYESQLSNTITGRMASITYPNGRKISYQYTGPNNGINCADGSTAGLTRTVTGDAVYQYTRNTSSWLTTTLVNDYGTGLANNTNVYTFIENSDNQMFLSKEVINQGTSTPLLTKIICYAPNGGPSNCLSLLAPFYPIQYVFTYSLPAGSANYSLVENTFDGLMNPLKTALSDFGTTTPTRQTVFSNFGYSWNGSSCVGIGSSVDDVPCEVQVQNGSGATLRQSYFTYGTTTAPGSLVSEQDFTGASTSITRSWTYNHNGTLLTSTDYNNNITNYTEGACNNGFLTKIVPPITTLDTQFSWDCNGAKMLSTTDPNQFSVSYTYYDPFWRLKSVTDQDLNVTNLSYGYNPPTFESILNWGTSTQDVYDQVNPSAMTSYHQVREGPSSANWDSTQNAMSWGSTGITTTTTMPCATSKGSGCSNGQITVTHDALGRPLVTTDGGGGTTTNTYTGSQTCTTGLSSCMITTTTVGPAPAGEVVKEVVTESNGLGQTVATCIISSATGSTPCGFGGYTGFPTSYVYNSDGTIASVSRSSSTNTQTHSFTYDELGRTLTATYPESGTTTYVYDTSTSGICVAGTYTVKGKLLEKHDANTNVYCYFYDTLGRVTGEAVNPAYGPNWDGAQKYFLYDSATVNGVVMTNTLGRLAEAYTQAPGSQTKLTDEGFSYEPRGKISDVYESTPNSGGYYHTSATYLPNYVVSSLSGVTGQNAWDFTVDGKGRPYSAVQVGGSNLVSSVTYNAADQPCVVTLGLGDADTYAYDNVACTGLLVTGRMSSYTFSVGATPTTDVGSLNWNANGTLRSLTITDGFNAGGTQTCNYGTSTAPGYDEQGRLVSAVCTNSSGTNVWGQNFSYDAFNNLTKSVPAGDAGVAWAPGYNEASNQYAGSGSCSSSSICYDANGNLLKDTFHTYTWNQDNHPLTVTPGGTSGPVVYDAFGRMVEHLYGTTYKQPLISPIGNIGLMSKTSVSQLRIPLPGGAIYDEANFWHTDWLGSVRLVSTRTGRTETLDRAFAPYGETYNPFGSTVDVNFTGDNQDLTAGTFDTPNRELNPTQGRWISPDPARSDWNAYAYSSNPLGETDPSGLTYAPFIIQGPPLSWPGGQNYCNVDGFSTSCGLANAVVQGEFGVDCTINNCPPGARVENFGNGQTIIASPNAMIFDNGCFGCTVVAENNGWITAATDVAGLVGLFLKEKVAKPLGRWGSAISILNDPTPKNVTINVLGQAPGMDGPMAITGAFNDYLDYEINNSTPGPEKVYNQDQLVPALPQQDGGCQASGLPTC